MTPGEFNILHVVHVVAALALFGCTFYAFGGPPETRGRLLMYSGFASLIVLLAGLRMWQLQFSFAASGWIFAKLICWLGVSALTGLGYRRRQKAGLFAVLAILLGAIAVSMAFYKPF
jgi:uncharacterized membrane protein